MVSKNMDYLCWRPYLFEIQLAVKKSNAFHCKKAGSDTEITQDYEYTDWNLVREFTSEFASNFVCTSKETVLEKELR